MLANFPGQLLNLCHILAFIKPELNNKKSGALFNCLQKAIVFNKDYEKLKDLTQALNLLKKFGYLTSSQSNSLISALIIKINNLPCELSSKLLEQIDPHYNKLVQDNNLLTSSKDGVILFSPAKSNSFISPNPAMLNQKSITCEKISITLPEVMTNINRRVEAYNVRDTGQMKIFETLLNSGQIGENKITYEFKKNQPRLRNANAEITIVYQPLTGGFELRAHAPIVLDKNSRTGKTLGSYVADYIFDPNHSGPYVFEFNDEVSYDSQWCRDYTSYFDHSDTPNCRVEMKPVLIRNQAKHKEDQSNYDIFFYPLRPIADGETLTFDYRYIGWPNHVYKHFSDNGQYDDNRFLQFKEFYTIGLFKFDEQTNKDLGLNSDVIWALPKMMTAIACEDIDLVKQEFSAYIRKQKGVNLKFELPMYCFTKEEKFVGSEERLQQHVTPFMYACYHGNEKIITLLLELMEEEQKTTLFKPTIDLDRCTMIGGLNALNILLKGKASKEVKERVGQMLIAKSSYPCTVDENELTALHYAIKLDSIPLVESLLNCQKHRGHQFLFEKMFLDRGDGNELPPHADFDYCLLNGNFKMLSLLLNFAVQQKTLLENNDDFIKCVKNGKIFKEQNILKPQVTLEHIYELKKLFTSPTLKNVIAKTNLLEILNRCIEVKKKEQSSIVDKVSKLNPPWANYSSSEINDRSQVKPIIKKTV